MKNNQWFKKIFAGEKIVKLIQTMDKFFGKLPHLPKVVIGMIVKILPWLTLVFGLISAVAALSSLVFLILSIIAWDFNSILGNLGGFLLILINTLFLLKAYKPLRRSDAIGWIYLFWGQAINIGYSIFDIASGNANIWWTIANVIIFTYLLFEIGPNYVYREEEENKI